MKRQYNSNNTEKALEAKPFIGFSACVVGSNIGVMLGSILVPISKASTALISNQTIAQDKEDEMQILRKDLSTSIDQVIENQANNFDDLRIKHPYLISAVEDFKTIIDELSYISEEQAEFHSAKQAIKLVSQDFAAQFHDLSKENQEIVIQECKSIFKNQLMLIKESLDKNIQVKDVLSNKAQNQCAIS